MKNTRLTAAIDSALDWFEIGINHIIYTRCHHPNYIGDSDNCQKRWLFPVIRRFDS